MLAIENEKFAMRPQSFAAKEEAPWNQGFQGASNEETKVLVYRRSALGQRVDVDAALAFLKADSAIDQRVNREVAAKTNVLTGTPLGATLTNDDVTGNDMLTAKFFDTEPFALTIASVFDGSLTFLVSHIGRIE